MARREATVTRFDLSNGFITEATELQFPANATLDESNMTIENDGARRRRNGVDYESNYVLHGSNNWQDGDAIATFEWRSAGGNPDDNFYVVQIGRTLHFYRINPSFSNNKHPDTIDLANQKESSATNTEVRQSQVDGAAGRSRFFIVGKYIEPFYISWDGSNFNTNGITIQERDFEGVDDNLGVSDRPNKLSSEHLYNLKNQGWADDDINTFHNKRNVYPSNADIWHFGKYNDVSLDGQEAWNPGQVVLQDFGNTRAPQGHFIHDIFNTTQSFAFSNTIDINTFSHDGSIGDVQTLADHNLSAGDSFVIDKTKFNYTDNNGDSQTYEYNSETYTVKDVQNSIEFRFDHDISNFDTTNASASYDGIVTNGNISTTINNPGGETTSARPISVAFFAGRVFWSGIAEDRLANKVYFTQIVQFDQQIGKCYQEADPTSEHISDIVDTDGGVITIAEMGTVKKMVVVGKNLVLFADNGIWNVGPGQQGFFTASSFSIRKISSLELASSQSVALVEGVPFAWTFSGIYTFQEDRVSGFLSPSSLSRETIQTFYRKIPDTSKNNTDAVYDEIDQKVYWVYSSDESNPEKYDSAIMLDLKNEAFQKYDFKSIENGPFIAGLARTLQFDVTDNKIKFLSIQEGDGKFTFSNLNETTFHDWKTFDGTGVDANAFLLTGYELQEDAAREKQTPQINFLFRRTETGTDSNGNLINPGSCLMQARWDWANNANSNKFNPERQVYKLRRNYMPSSHPSDYEDGYPVVWSRAKVRGRGKAFHMKLRSEENKDMHILGWQIKMSGGTDQ